MKMRTLHIGLGLVLFLALATLATAQPVEPNHVSADTNNAVIEGRVTLPSGFVAERNFRITLKNSQSTLSTLYSNKHGEFIISNLSEGIYYVEAAADDGRIEAVVEKIMLGRGIVWELTLQFREKQTPRMMS